jgi:hypothetical protein
MQRKTTRGNLKLRHWQKRSNMEIGKRGIPGGKHCILPGVLNTPPVPEAGEAGDGKNQPPTTVAKQV